MQTQGTQEVDRLTWRRGGRQQTLGVQTGSCKGKTVKKGSHFPSENWSRIFSRTFKMNRAHFRCLYYSSCGIWCPARDTSWTITFTNIFLIFLARSNNTCVSNSVNRPLPRSQLSAFHTGRSRCTLVGSHGCDYVCANRIT